MHKLPIIILAGRPKERDALMEAADVDNKIFIQYNGRSLIQILLEAIIASNVASSLLIVGIKKETISLPSDLPPTEFLEIEGPQYDKIHSSVEYITNHPETFGAAERVIITTADQPIVTGEAIRGFVDKCEDRQAEFYYSIVPVELALEGLSDFPWSYMKIKSGKYVSGNFGLVDPRKVVERYDMIKFVSDNRKSFIWGVLKASPLMFLKLVFGRIRIEEAEKLMTSYFDLTSKLVISDHFEIGLDIDKPKHLDYFDINKQ